MKTYPVRHEDERGVYFELEPSTPQYYAIVGWNRVKGTYFAEVSDAIGDEPEILVWSGLYPREVLHPSKLAEQVAGYATLPSSLIAILQRLRMTSV